MAFTTIANGQDLQALALVNELYNAWSERSQAIAGSSVAALTAGQDIQNHAFWQDMHDWITTNCVSFVDYAATFTDYAAVPMLTANLLKDASHANLTGGSSGVIGFRRVSGANWPADWTDYADAAYSYGPCQAGDIIGPWLWVDLQAAFKALKWTTLTSLGATGGVDGNPTSVHSGQRIYQATNNDCATAKTDHDNGWTSAIYDSAGHSILLIIAEAYKGSPTPYIYRSWRSRGKATVSSVPTVVNSTYDIWVKLINTNSVVFTFSDFDGLGLVENKLFKIASEATASNASTRTTAMIEGDSQSPVDDRALDCTTIAAGNQRLVTAQSSQTVEGTSYGLNYWVFKWDFTYQ